MSRSLRAGEFDSGLGIIRPNPKAAQKLGDGLISREYGLQRARIPSTVPHIASNPYENRCSVPPCSRPRVILPTVDFKNGSISAHIITARIIDMPR